MIMELNKQGLITNLHIVMDATNIRTASTKTPTRESVMFDKFEIAELINNWTFFRDQGLWEQLTDTFHDEGTISLSWFDGPFKIFVKASKEMAKNKGATLKHFVGTPMIKINGTRAISEVNITIMVRVKTEKGEIDNTSYARFYDFVEKKDGKWKILKRIAIYEKDRLDPVQQPYLEASFFKGIDEYPPQLRFLAGALKKAGKEISKSVIIDKSQELENLYKEGNAWLSKGQMK